VNTPVTNSSEVLILKSLLMRVLLKTKGTGYYYGSPHQITTAAREARDFVTVSAATRFALCEHLWTAEIILRWESPDYEIALPVLREWCQLDKNHRLTMREPDAPVPAASLRPELRCPAR
jgi:hypothetical protein